MKAAFSEEARAAHQMVLWPIAAVAPIALPWTRSVSFAALAVYEAVLLAFLVRARRGRARPISNTVLNLAALVYLVGFLVEMRMARHGLVRIASHLLLFTAAAKFASLKSDREVRTELLLCFFLALDSAATSTHASSLLYLALLAIVAFRALARIALLSDFGARVPRAAVTAVPTAGVSVLALAGIALVAIPLFAALPRLQSPFLHAAVPSDLGETSFSTSDHVDLDSFSASKRTDRVLLTLVPLRGRLPNPLRLREASFNHYQDGRWTRRGLTAIRPGDRGASRISIPEELRTGRALGPVPAQLHVDLSSFAPGFLFVPYAAESVTSGRMDIAIASDGTLAYGFRNAERSYDVEYAARASSRAPGPSRADAEAVAPEIRRLSDHIVAGSATPTQKVRRLVEYFRTGFVYTLDPATPRGDPVVDFLTRTRSGHCEYFASALVLLMRAQAIPARLVTGSLGGEIAPFSSKVYVRGENLHAWVEADVDGTGYRVFDPTPPQGLPGIERVSLWKRLSRIGSDIEFFYDRNILGFSALDQAGLIEAVRNAAQSLAGAAGRIPARIKPKPVVAASAAALFAFTAILLGRRLRHASSAPAARVYLRLRRLYRRRVGPLPDSAASSEVVKGFGRRSLAAGSAAREIVTLYRREAFAGARTTPEGVRALRRALIRLRRALAVLLAAAVLPSAPVRLRADSETPRSSDLDGGRKSDLSRLRERVGESKRRLAEFERTARSLAEEVRTLDLKVDVATRSRELIAAEKSDLEARNAVLAHDLDRVRRAGEQAREALAARIALLSRLGRYGYLRLMLAPRDRADWLTALKSLDAMARTDAFALSRYRVTRERLERDLAARTALEAEAARLLAEDREQERRVLELKRDRVALLEKSRNEVFATRRQVHELSDKASKLESLLDVLSRGESTLSGSPRPWKGVLDWPCRGTIAVTFGRHRHPRFDAWTISNGVEIDAADGAPVHAVYTGKVIFARWFSDYGNMVVLDHGDGVLTLYARLRSILVHVGDLVNAGDRVGLVGTGPGEDRPSLYFEVRDHEKATDPLTWLR